MVLIRAGDGEGSHTIAHAGDVFSTETCRLGLLDKLLSQFSVVLYLKSGLGCAKGGHAACRACAGEMWK